MHEGGENIDPQEFIDRWEPSGGAERSNYQSFLIDLCDLLEVPRPDPAVDHNHENAYVFERSITFPNGDGTSTTKYIDLYKRGCFILETKQGVEREETEEEAALSEAAKERRKKRKKGHGLRGSRAWDRVMRKARGQAETYARGLPAEESRPPFVVVIDVGHCIELYSEFTRTGGTYVPFPDPRTHRITIKDLAKPEVRETLRTLWLDPMELDPSRKSARVTRDIASKLARLAKSLEEAQHRPKLVAEFLMRCLFTMFAEDIHLLPNGAFTKLLEGLREKPEGFKLTVEGLWKTMNDGGFSPIILEKILRFNGGLFKDQHALDLTRDQLELLIEAAKADWRDVEPAIFGTLLERALDPRERHKLGAHYTPRAYVERLVIPTIVEPLRDEWEAVQAAAYTLAEQDKDKEARKEVDRFHHRLCNVRVLDPACGSGNFLYVTLEHLKRLEGEVFNTLTELGEEHLFEGEEITVSPRQLLGIELNPRAAAITELVLWIGYLQWHHRTHGDTNPPEPIIKDFHNIECRDAVLDYDDKRVVIDPETNRQVTRWDGHTTKPHPVTGEEVPDETARTPVYEYINPRKAEWPEADFVVGNPPFIGAALMRQALGDGYTETIRKTISEVPESCDYVMYWWNHAAELLGTGAIRRFGLIATNSLRQTFNRRVIEQHMSGQKAISLLFAIPDHPWVDSSDGAAVRISMTVCGTDIELGILQESIDEQRDGSDEVNIIFRQAVGKINPSLTIGPNVGACVPLKSNSELSNRGVQLIGSGFILTDEEAQQLGKNSDKALREHIREYRNGRDLTQVPRGVFVIDLYGLNEEDVRNRFPRVYQWILERVKPERDQNKRKGYREKWWIFGEPRADLRASLDGLARYVSTVETSKHRFFQFLDREILPDNMLVNIAMDDAYALGTLSSRIHVAWALAQGGTLEDRPRYNKTRCFETFPFPDPAEPLKGRIRELGERLDAHRKARQAEHPGLTMTGMYNVLEKLRASESVPPASSRSGSSGKMPEVHGDDLRQDAGGTDEDLRQDASVPSASSWRKSSGKMPEVRRDSSPGEEHLRQDAGGTVVKREGKFLPHWTQDGATYFVTFRLADSVPKKLAEQYRAERQRLLDEADKASGRKREQLLNQARNVVTGRFDALLDSGDGAAYFNDPRAAEIVANALNYFDGDRYVLWAYCVMPNHVHAVVEPLGEHGLDSILHSWKSFTANAVNKLLGRSGALWQEESFDHLIRRAESFEHYINYTLDNPVKAGLRDWEWVGSSVAPASSRRKSSGRMPEVRRASGPGEEELRQDAGGTEEELRQDASVPPASSWRSDDLRQDAGGTGTILSEKEREIHDQGLVSVLKEIHDELDEAVFEAYGWPAGLSDEEILERLVALNAERAAEERRGYVRWLRPEFQRPEGAEQTEAEAEEIAIAAADTQTAQKRKWPREMAAQAQAVREALGSLNGPAGPEQVAQAFKKARRDRVEDLLETLSALGQCRQTPDGLYIVQ